MKKNLFLLFSFYFFVLQSVFIWFLRWENKFFWLALINCAFICLIAIFARDGNSSTEEKWSWKYENVMKKESEFKINHFWIFLISFLFWILVVFWLKDIALYLRVGAWILWAMIIFLFWGLIFNYRALRVWEWKFYSIMLILALIWSIIRLLNIDFSVFQFKSEDEFHGLTWEVVEENLVITWDVELQENTGDVVDILTWVEEEINEEMWELAEIFWEDVDLDSLATFADVIKYLLRDEVLSEKTNVAFTYVSKTNELYPYFKTAQERSMIWKDTDPNWILSCETYVTMEWLAEGWNVWKYTDIKQAYRNYAKNNWLLPGCDYWKYIKIWDLK